MRTTLEIKDMLIELRCPDFFDGVKDGHAAKFDTHLKKIISKVNLVIDIEQQLSECQAALLVKDETIEFLADGMNPESMGYRDAQKALALQPGTEALEEWLGEPVAWKDATDGVLFHSPDLATDIPLYAKPKGIS